MNIQDLIAQGKIVYEQRCEVASKKAAEDHEKEIAHEREMIASFLEKFASKIDLPDFMQTTIAYIRKKDEKSWRNGRPCDSEVWTAAWDVNEAEKIGPMKLYVNSIEEYGDILVKWTYCTAEQNYIDETSWRGDKFEAETLAECIYQASVEFAHYEEYVRKDEAAMQAKAERAEREAGRLKVTKDMLASNLRQARLYHPSESDSLGTIASSLAMIACILNDQKE